MNHQALINRTESRHLIIAPHGAEAYVAVQEFDADNHQFGTEAPDDEDRKQRLDELKLELASDMRAALIGEQSFVPTYTRTSDGIRRERPGMVMLEVLEVLEVLEHNDCGQAFSDVLKRSQCPLVASLREMIVNHYVAEAFEGLADARGL